MSEIIDKISKLPLWAQDHFNQLTRERDTAIRQLEEFLNSQEESSIYVRELSSHTSPPTFIRKYIQGDQINVAEFDIRVLRENEGEKTPIKGIRISGEWRVIIRPESANVFIIEEEK